MAAVTRWVDYLITEEGSSTAGEAGVNGAGTPGSRFGTAAVSDSFNIGTTNNRLYLTIDGFAIPGNYITLASGSDLDPRFVAKDIAEKIHAKGSSGPDRLKHAKCFWVNNDSQNRLEIYSGNLGSNASVVVTSGVNTAHLELGFGTSTASNGAALDPDLGGSNFNNGGVLVSGTYTGFFDEIYKIVIGDPYPINTPVQGGGNPFLGDITAAGAYEHSQDYSYIISIDTTSGTTMNAGTGNVPTMSWTEDNHGVDNGGPIELLYSDYWYNVGTHGLMVKFTDDEFTTVNPAWTIDCDAVDAADGGNADAPAGTAKYFYCSNRGDCSTVEATTAVSGSYCDLGNRGLSISFNGSNNLKAGDTFYVMATPPQPNTLTTNGISNLNYGNVTVTTESSVKTVMFEIKSGAVKIDTVKFGLQSHGTFSHHNEGLSDTYFRFGTVGPGNTAGIGDNEYEWMANVEHGHLSGGTSYLYATDANLSVVADADSSESIGTSTYMGMVADPIWLNIKLGTSEVGANSTINYRIYFDYL
jgi:hypothetical protein